MSEFMDSSFDKDDIVEDCREENGVVSDFPDDGPIPVKKLQEQFDSLVKTEDTSFKVYLRVRPVSENTEITAKVVSDTVIVTNAPTTSNRAKYTKLEERYYSFTKVFGPSSSQRDIFDNTVDSLLDKFLRNENCVFFAYGMTNAGKTYTIQGTPQDPGIIPILTAKILSSASSFEQCCLQVSMVEIYNDNVYDLSIKSKPKLKVRDANGRVEICQLSYNPVSTVQDATKVFERASANRCQASTLLNAGSSRSHALYIFTLSHRLNGADASSSFQIVDLAGAERMVRTEANKNQQAEANSINKSLMQLWLCLDKMKKKSADIIPFRENKLTHLLMPILTRVGLANVAMVTCVNPQPNDYDETISILDNASLAHEIRELPEIRPEKAVRPIKNGKIAAAAAAYVAAAAGGKKRKAEVDEGKPRKVNSRGEQVNDKVSLASSDADGQSTVSISGVSKMPSQDETEARLSSEAEWLRVEKVKMQIEIDDLRQENEMLQTKLCGIEAEVRLEVSQEMAQSSALLLDRIRELQEQNHSNEYAKTDLTKSCKKERQKHLAAAQEELARSLEEAYEECERVKAEAEATEIRLLAENAQLAQEVLDIRSKYEAAQKVLASVPRITSSASTSPNHSSGSVLVLPVGSSNLLAAAGAASSNCSAAESFNMRMGRDARFKQLGGQGKGLGESDENSSIQQCAKTNKPFSTTDGNNALSQMRLRNRVL